MGDVGIGQKAPSFRLPSGNGTEIGPEDYRGRSTLVVWFTKGMACSFCRTQMSQLARGYPRLQAAGAEVMMITPTKPDRARFYARNFSIPFVYLCDPDYAVYRQWGVGVREHSVAWYARTFVAASRMPKPPAAEIGDPKMTLREMPSLLADTDMGLFVVDCEGVVRYQKVASYVDGNGIREIPSVDELLAQVQRCAKPA